VALTAFGVQIRYPGDLVEILPGQERWAFDVTRAAREEIRRVLDAALG